MALFKIFKGSSDQLGQEPINANLQDTRSAKEGFAYFTPDDGKFYIDINDANIATIGTNRIPINAYKADKFSSGKVINITGDVIGTAASDATTGWDITTELKPSGVIEGIYGPEVATVTQDGRFIVPRITIDEKGIITNAESFELTIPDLGLDTKVTQTKELNNGYYYPLFTPKDQTATTTTTATFNDIIKVNPYISEFTFVTNNSDSLHDTPSFIISRSTVGANYKLWGTNGDLYLSTDYWTTGKKQQYSEHMLQLSPANASLIIQGHLLPKSAGWTLGSALAPWSAGFFSQGLMVGGLTEYGSTSLPVYWHNGIPTPITSYEGTANRAVSDEDGNNFKSTYAAHLSLTNGLLMLKNMNGAALDSISIGTLTAADIATGTEEISKFITAKAIKTAISNEINDLDVSETTFANGEILKTLKEENGKISFTTGQLSIDGGRINQIYQIVLKEDTNTIAQVGIPQMTGATENSAGQFGMVPTPSQGDQVKYLRGDGLWSEIAEYTLPVATSSNLGGIKIGYSESGNNYAVKLNAQKAYVTVPWTDRAVTSPMYHYSPEEDNNSGLSANASGGTATWGADVVKGVSLKRDTKGHVVGIEVISGKIPDQPTNLDIRDPSYGVISIGAASSAVNAPTSNTNTISAASYTEKVTFNASNKWIRLGATDSSTSGSDKIYFGHTLSDATAGSYGPSSNQTPDYGATFTVPYITIDAAGHVSAIAEKTVKIPQGIKGPMEFKGTLGTGGTITALPAADNTNVGNTYKVITGGRYSQTQWEQDAEYGDMVISDGSKWILIPSGDAPLGTVTNIATGAGLTGGPISGSGEISHADTSNQTSLTATSKKYVNAISLDDFGHVTSIGTGTVEETDTLVKQTALSNSSNANYKILTTKVTNPTSGNAAEAAYDVDITLNPSTNTIIAANFAGALKGNADTATSASKLQNTSKIGDTNHPVYFTANGVPAEVTLTSTANNLLSNLPSWTANPTDSTVLIRKDVSGNNSFGQVTFETVWNYINSKMISTGSTLYMGYLNAATSSNANTTFWIHTNIQPTDSYIRIIGELVGAGSDYSSGIIHYSLYVKDTAFGNCYYTDMYNKLNVEIQAVIDDNGYLHIGVTPKAAVYTQWYMNCLYGNTIINRIDSINQTAPSTTAYSKTFTKQIRSITYTPEGTNAKSEVVISPTTTDVYSITNVGTAPSLTMSVDDSTETLSFTWSAGAVPTRSSAIAAWTGYNTGVNNTYAKAQVFTGTQATLTI